MALLISKNVDSYEIVGQYENLTEALLIEYFGYYHDKETAIKYAKTLFSNSYLSLDDPSCTEYEIR